jgi:hypothetical protein
MLAASVLVLTPAHSAYFGIGISSCATWQSKGNENQGKVWILGFFSGMSAMDSTGDGVGNETDGPAILAEVALICARNPSMKLRKPSLNITAAFSKLKCSLRGMLFAFGL